MRRDEARSNCAVRLRPRPVGREEPANDRRRHASERRARAEQARAAAAALVSNGHIQIAIDHFVRPDDTLAAAAASGRLH